MPSPVARRPQSHVLYNLQVLRGVAALMVVLHHSMIQIDTFEQLFRGLNFGEKGVDVFFVISGFVIYLTAQKPKANACSFAVDRIV